jgi:hypothetical protein
VLGKVYLNIFFFVVFRFEKHIYRPIKSSCSVTLLNILEQHWMILPHLPQGAGPRKGSPAEAGLTACLSADRPAVPT